MIDLTYDYLADLTATLRKYADDPRMRDCYVVCHLQLKAQPYNDGTPRMTDAELGAEVRLLLTALKAAEGTDDVPRGV